MAFKKILLTTDLSENSLRAFGVAADVTKANDSELHILHVACEWQVPPHMIQYIPSPDSIEAYNKQIIETSEKTLKKYAEEYFNELNPQIHVELYAESAWKKICEFADENQYDLIILTSHGRGAVGQFFLGSVANKVTAKASCPVLVIPGQH